MWSYFPRSLKDNQSSIELLYKLAALLLKVPTCVFKKVRSTTILRAKLTNSKNTWVAFSYSPFIGEPYKRSVTDLRFSIASRVAYWTSSMLFIVRSYQVCGLFHEDHDSSPYVAGFSHVFSSLNLLFLVQAHSSLSLCLVAGAQFLLDCIWLQSYYYCHFPDLSNSKPFIFDSSLLRTNFQNAPPRPSRVSQSLLSLMHDTSQLKYVKVQIQTNYTLTSDSLFVLLLTKTSEKAVSSCYFIVQWFIKIWVTSNVFQEASVFVIFLLLFRSSVKKWSRKGLVLGLSYCSIKRRGISYRDVDYLHWKASRFCRVHIRLCCYRRVFWHVRCRTQANSWNV